VCARDIPERVNHCQHDQAESQCDANMRDRTATRLIDYDCASAGKHECESADKLRNILFHLSVWCEGLWADFLAPFFDFGANLVSDFSNLAQLLLSAMDRGMANAIVSSHRERSGSLSIPRRCRQ
jgi:hypothetical protein